MSSSSELWHDDQYPLVSLTPLLRQGLFQYYTNKKTHQIHQDDSNFMNSETAIQLRHAAYCEAVYKQQALAQHAYPQFPVASSNFPHFSPTQVTSLPPLPFISLYEDLNRQISSPEPTKSPDKLHQICPPFLHCSQCSSSSFPPPTPQAPKFASTNVSELLPLHNTLSRIVHEDTIRLLSPIQSPSDSPASTTLSQQPPPNVFPVQNLPTTPPLSCLHSLTSDSAVNFLRLTSVDIAKLYPDFSLRSAERCADIFHQYCCKKLTQATSRCWHTRLFQEITLGFTAGACQLSNEERVQGSEYHLLLQTHQNCTWAFIQSLHGQPLPTLELDQLPNTSSLNLSSAQPIVSNLCETTVPPSVSVPRCATARQLNLRFAEPLRFPFCVREFMWQATRHAVRYLVTVFAQDSFFRQLLPFDINSPPAALWDLFASLPQSSIFHPPHNDLHPSGFPHQNDSSPTYLNTSPVALHISRTLFSSQTTSQKQTPSRKSSKNKSPSITSPSKSDPSSPSSPSISIPHFPDFARNTFHHAHESMSIVMAQAVCSPLLTESASHHPTVSPSVFSGTNPEDVAFDPLNYSHMSYSPDILRAVASHFPLSKLQNISPCRLSLLAQMLEPPDLVPVQLSHAVMVRPGGSSLLAFLALVLPLPSRLALWWDISPTSAIPRNDIYRYEYYFVSSIQHSTDTQPCIPSAPMRTHEPYLLTYDGVIDEPMREIYAVASACKVSVRLELCHHENLRRSILLALLLGTTMARDILVSETSQMSLSVLWTSLCSFIATNLSGSGGSLCLANRRSKVLCPIIKLVDMNDSSISLPNKHRDGTLMSDAEYLAKQYAAPGLPVNQLSLFQARIYALLSLTSPLYQLQIYRYAQHIMHKTANTSPSPLDVWFWVVKRSERPKHEYPYNSMLFIASTAIGSITEAHNEWVFGEADKVFFVSPTFSADTILIAPPDIQACYTTPLRAHKQVLLLYFFGLAPLPHSFDPQLTPESVAASELASSNAPSEPEPTFTELLRLVYYRVESSKNFSRHAVTDYSLVPFTNMRLGLFPVEYLPRPILETLAKRVVSFPGPNSPILFSSFPELVPLIAQAFEAAGVSPRQPPRPRPSTLVTFKAAPSVMEIPSLSRATSTAAVATQSELSSIPVATTPTTKTPHPPSGTDEPSAKKRKNPPTSDNTATGAKKRPAPPTQPLVPVDRMPRRSTTTVTHSETSSKPRYAFDSSSSEDEDDLDLKYTYKQTSRRTKAPSETSPPPPSPPSPVASTQRRKTTSTSSASTATTTIASTTTTTTATTPSRRVISSSSTTTAPSYHGRDHDIPTATHVVPRLQKIDPANAFIASAAAGANSIPNELIDVAGEAQSQYFMHTMGCSFPVYQPFPTESAKENSNKPFISTGDVEVNTTPTSRSFIGAHLVVDELQTQYDHLAYQQQQLQKLERTVASQQQLLDQIGQVIAVKDAQAQNLRQLVELMLPHIPPEKQSIILANLSKKNTQNSQQTKK